jgi:acyl-CoA dehydrogenase
MAGAARGAYELTRQHLRTRQQFGKPLVALPSVASSLATMRVAVLQAEAAVAASLAVADSKVPGHTAAAAATARVVAATAATSVAERAHQLHGAIGTTREYSLHHLTRMLWALRDADLPEQAWRAGLGARAVTAGEDQVWNVLTAPAALSS